MELAQEAPTGYVLCLVQYYNSQHIQCNKKIADTKKNDVG
jgi:hypothetical protein